MKKQFAIIGLGRFGASIGEELMKMGHQVLAIEKDSEKVDSLARQFTHCVQADGTDEDSLRDLGLRNLDGVIIAISQIESSILMTMHLKDLGVPFVCAKSHSDMHTKLLYKVGADRVVFPERDMGIRLAHSLALSNIFEVIELSKQCSIIEIAVLDQWIGKSLKELDLRKHMGINIVGIKTGEEEVELTPNPDRPLQRGQTLIIVGKDTAIAKLTEK